MLIYYNSYVIPLKLLFDDSTADRPSTFSSEGMVVLDAIVDACFWADMVLNFRLGFYERHAETGLPDQVVMSPSRIAARYIRLWFWVDLIAVFPIYDIFRPLIASEDADAVIGTSNPLLLLRNLRLVRMLRRYSDLHLLWERRLRDALRLRQSCLVLGLRRGRLRCAKRIKMRCD